MASQSSGPRRFLMKAFSILLLAIILLISGIVFLHYCDRNSSPIVPLVQNGDKLSAPGIISEEGDLLLPVAEVARASNYQAETFQVKNEHNLLQAFALVLLPQNQTATGYMLTFYVDQNGLVTDLLVAAGSDLYTVEGEPVLYKNNLYLPLDFFQNALGLEVELTEDGKALLTPASQQPATETQPSQPQQNTNSGSNNQTTPNQTAPNQTTSEGASGANQTILNDAAQSNQTTNDAAQSNNQSNLTAQPSVLDDQSNENEAWQQDDASQSSPSTPELNENPLEQTLPTL